MLYKRGGVWADLDMICLNHIDLNQDYIFSQEIDEDVTKPRITTSFLKFPKGSEFGKNLINEANKIINNKKMIKWGIIGPWFLAEQVKIHNLEHFAWDYKDTCQIPWCNAKDFIKSKVEFDETKPFLHLYSEMWRSYALNKNHFYNNGIYGKLLKKHQIENLINELDFTFSFKDKYHIIFSILYYIKYPRRIFIKNKQI